ncbi:PfkB-like carbohydrate kinase family protein [Hibiscus syriacus]|uniref:PfkB-like carbohydrate kinase family protein n=1 Tax=Hibiscus syriacus TaxID=106335 RepID=A0A6A3D173_HIBSY|nr:PfkB-like carbohydrate kinase family protein [Hibiscus syriacus]
MVDSPIQIFFSVSPHSSLFITLFFFEIRVSPSPEMKRSATKKKRRPRATKTPSPNDLSSDASRKLDPNGTQKLLIDSLMEAFGSISLEEATSAYSQANGDLDEAAEILSNLIDNGNNSEDPEPSTSSISIDSSWSGSSGSGFAETGCSQNLNSGRARRRGGKQQKRVVAATGTVSTALGKDYFRSSPWRDPAAAAPARPVLAKEEAEQFLSSMLGDECELSMAVIGHLTTRLIHQKANFKIVYSRWAILAGIMQRLLLVLKLCNHLSQGSLNRISMAATAYSKGEMEYVAHLSDQGKIQTNLVREADERASQDIFKARNKAFENVITIDLHGQHVSQAMRLLKLHLLFGIYVPSIRTLRVITGCGTHGMGKSKLKQSIIRLLEKKDIQWHEQNRGTLLVKLDGYREFTFLDANSDTE